MIALLAVIALLVAQCEVREMRGIISEDKVLMLKNLVQTMYEKVSSEMLSLHPQNEYQFTLKGWMTEALRRVKYYINVGNRKRFENQRLLAALYYIVAFDYLNTIQSLMKFYKVPTLDAYVRELKAQEQAARAVMFDFYLMGSYGTGCLNETRVMYVKLRKLYSDIVDEIDNIITNMPSFFTRGLAEDAIGIVHRVSTMLVIDYLHYLVRPLHDTFILERAAECPPGFGSAWWVPYACAYMNSPMPPTPCSSIYAFVFRSAGLIDLAKAICGARK